jgi:hypothetical protein
MLWLWLLQAATAVMSWVTGWFPDWVIPYPADGLDIWVPMPFGLGGSEMGTWLLWTIAVSVVLMVGRFLTWVYEKIPFIG